MSGAKLGVKKVIPALVVIAVGGAVIAYTVRGNSNDSATTTVNTGSGTSKAATSSSPKKAGTNYAATSEFKYLIPDGWVLVKQSLLKETEANSGINVKSQPITFIVSVAESGDTPNSLPSYKTQVRETISKNINLSIQNEGPIEIDGQTGYQYTYKLGYDNLTEQKFIIFLKNNKAFSLIFTSPVNSFENQKDNLNKILASFQLL